MLSSNSDNCLGKRAYLKVKDLERLILVFFSDSKLR